MEAVIVVSEENATLPNVAASDAVIEVKQEANRMGAPKITGQLVTDLLKIATVIASISAVFHLYAFGITAKVNILAYVSLTDFLRVAIVWIAPTCLIQILAYFMGSAFTVIKNTSKSEHGTQTDKEPCIFCVFERKAKKLLVVALFTLDLATFAIDLSVWFNTGARHFYELLTLNLMLLWLCVVIWYISSLKRALNNNFMAYFDYITFVPILFIISVGSGLAHGANTLRVKTSDVVSVTVGSDVHRGELLFSFEKFVVVREFDREYITLIPADKVTSIRTAFNLTSVKESPPKK